MTPDRLAEIRRSAELVAYTERGEFGGEKLATYQLAAHVVPELLAEVERLTALSVSGVPGPRRGAGVQRSAAGRRPASGGQHLPDQTVAAVAQERDELLNDREWQSNPGGDRG